MSKNDFANSPEAILVAHIIRQALVDYTALKHTPPFRTVKFENVRLLAGRDAEEFLFQHLLEFIEWYGVEELFDPETILNKLQRNEMSP